MATDGTTLKGGGAIVHARTTLVLYHRDGATVAHLERGRALVIGRAAPSDLEIPDPGLSRQHARFLWDDTGIWVEDLGSTNGTKKNGEPITRAKLLAGDQVAIGPVVVSVHMVGSIGADDARASTVTTASSPRSRTRSRAPARSAASSRS